MYVNITGSKNNKDVYIYQSYRKANGKPSSRIYRKLGKYNDLLEQFSGDSDKLMAWAKEEAAKDTAEYNAKKEKVSIDFSQTYRIPLDEERSFHAGYLFCSSYAANYDWTTSAETSGITGRSPTIFTLFSRTLYTQESFLPPAN